MMADAAPPSDLELPPMPEDARRRMFDIVPYCAPGNPVDTAAAGMTDMTIAPDFSDIVLETGAVDALAIFMSHLGHVERRQDEVREYYGALKRKHPDKVIAFSISGPPDLRDELMEAGYFICEDPTATVRALGALTRISESLRRDRAADEPPDIGDAPAPPAAGPLGEGAALDMLASAGIPAVPHRIAGSADPRTERFRGLARELRG